MISLGFLLAFFALCMLVTQPHAAASDMPYTQAQLEANAWRLQEKIRQLWLLLYANLLPETEKRMLRDIRLRTPVVGMHHAALEFYSNTHSKEVFMPVVSVLLVEDLCTAYAWLQVHGYEHSTIDEYLAMLRYRDPRSFPERRFPPPLRALGIPENALDDPNVNSLSLRLRNNAWAFILLHELGHLRQRPSAQEGELVSVAQRREMQADAFALDVMARDDAVPVGAFLFWQASVHYFMNRGDFHSDKEWRRYIQREATHPVTAARALFIAHYLRNHAAAFGDGPRANPHQKQLVQDIAQKMETVAQWLGNADRQRGARELAKITTPETLKPRRPQRD